MDKFQIKIGELVETREPVYLDLRKLVETRALIEASSGGGKSTLMRLIAERAAGVMQTIILDHEDEFVTLRKVLDVLLVGDGRDVPITVESAALLARRLAEMRISVVINLYDLALDGRRAFVGEFLSALLNVPKSMWHPTLIMLDEAHIYAPEKGDVASRAAVVNMMSQGRKREFCEIVATQRFSKIDKDGIADAKNVFIGGTVLDVDQKRAGDILGLKTSDYARLRDMASGEWYAFGPALVCSQKGVIHFLADKPQTEKPKSGTQDFVVPKASEVIGSLVAQLGDIPAQARAEIETLERLQTENARLQRELKARPVQVQMSAPRVEIQVVEKPVLNGEVPALLSGIEQLRATLAPLRELPETLTPLANILTVIVEKVERVEHARQTPHTVEFKPPARLPVPVGAPRMSADNVVPAEGLTVPQQRILDALAEFQSLGLMSPHKSNVAVFAEQSPTSSGYQNNLGRLRVLGLVEYPGSGRVALTAQGSAVARAANLIRSRDDLHQAWLARLPRPQGKILQQVIAAYPHAVGKNDLAERAGQSPTSSGYKNNLGALRSLGLIDYPRAGFVVATTLLFPDGLR